MTNIAFKDYSELWKSEPDIAKLTEAHDVLMKDPIRSVAALEKLIEEGSTVAKMYLAHAYDGARDAPRAEFWYKQAFEAGVLQAICGMADFYWRQKKLVEAEQVLLVGVAHNDPLAMLYLARLYLKWPNSGDHSAAVKDLLERSMKMGQVWSKNLLAFQLMKGRYGLSGIPRGAFLYITSIVDGIRFAHSNPDDRRFRP